MARVACQADCGVLVVNCSEGEYETGLERGGQTREHAILLCAMSLLLLHPHADAKSRSMRLARSSCTGASLHASLNHDFLKVGILARSDVSFWHRRNRSRMNC